MGQYAHFAFFDSDWDERIDVALTLLREAADLYASQGAGAIAIDRVLASWLWVLATPLPARAAPGSPRLPLRFFEDHCAPKPAAEASCEALRTAASASVEHALSELTQIVRTASATWSEGDPETPDARSVSQALLGVLWTHRFGRRPPSKQYPVGI